MDWTDFWAQFMPPQKNAPWTPTYLPQQYVVEPDNSGGMARQPINIFYFPDAATCQHLLEKYCPKGVIHAQPFVDAGPDGTQAEVPYLVWSNGVVIMAGAMAALWSQNPGHQDVADKLCLDAIKARGAM
ncbi:MAG TPA: hypothetical protein VNH18_06950 [Bryobacteraceae bacterium]|nr:hypothetical protein [Blastocatellia bacterium]HXJ38998.1 hypothetical protein [Bryobacteraceae bacterium]